MSSHDHTGSPYLAGADNAGQIEGRTAWARHRARLDAEAEQQGAQVTGSEVQQEQDEQERR